MVHLFEGLRHLPEVWLCDFIILNYLQRLNQNGDWNDGSEV